MINFNYIDSIATLLGVHRLPKDDNREMIYRIATLNGMERGPTPKYIVSYIAEHLKLNYTLYDEFNSTDSELGPIYFVLDNTPMYRNSDGSQADIELTNSSGDIKYPIYRHADYDVPETYKKYIDDSSGPGLIVFPHDSKYLSKIIRIDSLFPGAYKIKYTYNKKQYTETITYEPPVENRFYSLKYSNTIVAYDLTKPDPILMDGINPNSRLVQLEDFIERLSPKRWGHKNISTDISPSMLGTSYPTHLDASINSSNRISQPNYIGTNNEFTMGIEKGSFDIIDYTITNDSLEMITTPGIVNYNNSKIFIGARYIVIKEPGDRTVSFPISIGHPVDIVKYNITKLVKDVAVPSGLFFAESSDDFYDILILNDIPNGVANTSKSNFENYGVIYAIDWLLSNNYFVSTEIRSGLIPSSIHDTTPISDATILSSELFEFGYPLEITKDGSNDGSAPSIESISGSIKGGYNISIQGSEFVIDLPEEDVDDRVILAVLLHRPYRTIMNRRILNVQDMNIDNNNISVGLGITPLVMENVYCTIGTNVIDDIINIIVIPIGKTGSTFYHKEFKIRIKKSGSYLNITSPTTEDSDTTLKTNTNNFSFIEVNIINDGSLNIGDKLEVYVEHIESSISRTKDIII